MLRFRPYKPCDAAAIVSWIGDEVSFRKWCADRYESYPITADDMNRHYHAFDDSDNFYPMTAFDETGVAGHLILRFTDEQKSMLRLGFVIVDGKKRGMGYGKQMLELAVKYAFEILKAEKITLCVFDNNEPAYRCYQSVGFREVPCDEPEYEVFQEKWTRIEMELVP